MVQILPVWCVKPLIVVLFPLLSFVHMGEKEMREGREERGLPGSFFCPPVGTETEYGGDWRTRGERRGFRERVRDDISGISKISEGGRSSRNDVASWEIYIKH